MPTVKLNLKTCKENLEGGIDNLKASLKENPQLSLAQQLKYRKALAEMGVAYVLLKKIPCEQPNMTFEIPPLQKRRARRSKRSKGRKR
jgi:hypothetical protein